jgi:hypothetical protein
MEDNYINKYLKYKFKYIKFKNQLGGEITELLTRFLNHTKYPKYVDTDIYNNKLLKSLVNKIIEHLIKTKTKTEDEKLLDKTIKLYLPFYYIDKSDENKGDITVRNRTSIINKKLNYLHLKEGNECKNEESSTITNIPKVQPLKINKPLKNTCKDEYTDRDNKSKIINGNTHISNGTYGVVYKFKIDKKDVILKVPTQINVNIINEAFVNLCIINDYIIKYPNDHHLVFTYGLFFCNVDKSESGTQICNENKENEVKGYPYIHLIQDYLKESKTLKDVLLGSDIDLITLKKYISQIFSQLANLQNGKFKLKHNDLSFNNIMIKDDKAYIIDWGCASFTHDDVLYYDSNHIFMDYSSNDDTIINSVIDDVYLFITHIRMLVYPNKENVYDKKNHEEIYKYIYDILVNHFYTKIYKNNIEKIEFIGKPIDPGPITLPSITKGNSYWIYKKWPLIMNKIEQNFNEFTYKNKDIPIYEFHNLLQIYPGMNTKMKPTFNKTYFETITYEYALEEIFKVPYINKLPSANH